MRMFWLFLLVIALSQHLPANHSADQPEHPSLRTESLDSLLEQAPVFDLARMLITDSGIKYIIPISEKIRNILYIFFSDTGYNCIYDLQSYHENNWKTARRFILGESGVVNQEIRLGADFGGGDLKINYKVVSEYSLKGFEFDGVHGIAEAYKVFEFLDKLKGYSSENETVSFNNDQVIPITFAIGDARISYFIVTPESPEIINRIAFMRYDPQRNKLAKLSQLLSHSLSLTHNLLWILTDNAVGYLESMIK